MNDPTIAALMLTCTWLKQPPRRHYDFQNDLIQRCRELKLKVRKLNKLNVDAHYQIKYLEDQLMECQTARDHLIHVLNDIHYQTLNALGVSDAYEPF